MFSTLRNNISYFVCEFESMHSFSSTERLRRRKNEILSDMKWLESAFYQEYVTPAQHIIPVTVVFMCF